MEDIIKSINENEKFLVNKILMILRLFLLERMNLINLRILEQQLKKLHHFLKDLRKKYKH